MGFQDLVIRTGVSLFQRKCRFKVCQSSQLVFQHFLNPCFQSSLPKYTQSAISKAFKSTKSTNKPNQIPTENLKRRPQIYSPEDDKQKVEQVKLNGGVRKTGAKIAKVLGIKDQRTVEERYKNHSTSQKFVKGKFSPEEDKIIREHVDQHGRDNNSLRKLAAILNRSSTKGSIESIRKRHVRLISENEYETSGVPAAWKLEEDETLIRYILKLKQIKDKHDVNLIENISRPEFSGCSKALKRSNESCYHHWMCVIVPVLKTHFLGLPLNVDWKLKMMSYIVENKIKYESEVDIDLVLDRIAPGQTKNSLFIFESTLRVVKVNGRKTKSELFLYQLVENRLKEQSQNNPCFNKNHKREEKRLKRANDIIDFYLKTFE